MALDPQCARNYIAHTTVGDPLCDKMIAELEQLPLAEADLYLRAAVENPDDPVLRDVPASVTAFIEDLESPPDWVNPDDFGPGIRAFHRDPSACLAAMLGGVLVEGFATSIARSFFITGRLRDQGVRRLRQNNRHMIEILLPGGLATRGDGWKLSVRIRLIHAKVRKLLAESAEWQSQEWGLPLSAAQLGYALTAFSARMLSHMKSLGAKCDEEERDGFMAVWRYSGHLMGIPNAMLYHDHADALKLFKIGGMCEPAPSMESIAMSNSLVQSAPIVAGITEAADRQKLAKYVFLVSRALIGDRLADRLNYPPGRTFGVLPWFRLQRRFHRFLRERAPTLARESGFAMFNTLLDVSDLNEFGITYKLPDHAYAEESRQW